MAKTYSAIQTITVASTVSSVTFSNIPQNYTDLQIVASSRTASTGASSIQVTFNGSGSYSNKELEGTGSAAASYAQSANYFGSSSGSTDTTYTFGNSSLYIPNYTSSNSKSSYGDGVTENNATAAYQLLDANLYTGTSPITTITLSTAGNIAAGSTFTLYGIGSGAKASGGTVVGSGNYIYHTFTSSGTFTPTEQIKNAEILLVAGGGGGGYQGTSGNQEGGGGGGAGGLLYVSGNSLTAGTNYSVVIGAGGAANTSGANSLVGSIATAIGGGYGGLAASSQVGGNGGSGGGTGGFNVAGVGIGTLGQGNNGGNTTSSQRGGGGGGAGGAGANGSVSGNGGIGSSTYSSWHYATQTGVNLGGTYSIAGGGGGGGGYVNSAGPTGGSAFGGGGAGGNGGSSSGGGPGTAGTTNTGGGGGAGAGSGTGTSVGGAGGSGLVVIRYPVN